MSEPEKEEYWEPDPDTAKLNGWRFQVQYRSCPEGLPCMQRFGHKEPAERFADARRADGSTHVRLYDIAEMASRVAEH